MATSDITVARTVAALRDAVAAWRAHPQTVALVPTMGALHRGHLALVAAARRQCDRVVASLFVNPKQFGPREDFAAYPRDEAADLAKFRDGGVDLVFAPTVEEMYPAGFVTTVHITGIGDALEGAHRPGHFDGVATVVSKLLLQCVPDAAFFGEKDYQQLLVVRRIARDLDIPVRIEGVATVREPDGLALSSRNIYLSPEERRIAPRLHEVLNGTAAAIVGAPDSIATSLQSGNAALRQADFAPDYLDLRDADDLSPMIALDRPARLLVAARLGHTRLIDNIPVIPR
jgi:pantoate--beta-alanine ligase